MTIKLDEIENISELKKKITNKDCKYLILFEFLLLLFMGSGSSVVALSTKSFGLFLFTIKYIGLQAHLYPFVRGPFLPSFCTSRLSPWALILLVR